MHKVDDVVKILNLPNDSALPMEPFVCCLNEARTVDRICRYNQRRRQIPRLIPEHIDVALLSDRELLRLTRLNRAAFDELYARLETYLRPLTSRSHAVSGQTKDQYEERSRRDWQSSPLTSRGGTLLRTNYDTLTDMYAKRRIMEELQSDLRQHFRGHHTITQIQRRWFDMKRRERSFVREVRREHVPDAQMPTRRHCGDAGNEDSDEAHDQPPPLDVGEEGGPSHHPPDVGPPALEAEPLGGPQDVLVAPEGPPAPAAARQHGRRRNRRSELAAIARQLAQLAASLQGALSDSE
ncbi:uncharacterized protein [Hyperolius riggenbachi]|uniref:uncharacterized protein n=1 Tax=Hyperolius riggenbachi TaxID=752182 RepID=UPI0035A318D9